jgi:ribosome maturation factor RimP
MAAEPLFGELEGRVEELGFELVDLEQAGDTRRPILRLRIDRPDSGPSTGVSLDDCTRVSRALEPFLDAREDLSERYVLEVSSPGVERPLVRRRDWERFAGREVVIRGRGPLVGRPGKVQGELVGLVQSESGGEELAVLRLPAGEEVRVPLSEVKEAHLVYRWGKEERSSR